MKVTVIKVEEASGTRRDGTVFVGVRALCKFDDGITAEKIYIGDDVIHPDQVVSGRSYDMYRSSAGYVTIFDPIT